MIKPEQIPGEVVEAAAKELAYTNGWRNEQGIEVCKPVALDIIAAALAAWPGAIVNKPDEGTFVCRYGVILPLPTENSDE